MESFKQLEVWKRAMELTKEVYTFTNEFPKAELYGLTSQMRRAAVSIPSNIAEGYKRRNIGEYIQFLGIADASAAELETQIILSSDLFSNINLLKAESLLQETQKMLCSMLKKLNAKR
ncbi:MAG: four helix bundle protein [bacterium]|nr:four helix bundle protein [bacterium]